MGEAVATKGAGFSGEDANGRPGSGGATADLPRAFGRLLLLKLIARGGMGDVYLAATTGIEGAERPVVVKTVRRDHIHDGSFLARFLDEARVQAQLHHPSVAQVLEASTDEAGEPFTVVEYVEGRPLSEVRTRVAQSGVKLLWPEACSIGLEIAQALAHVHERAGADGSPLGIVHRDLSPQNVMVGFAGDVKLIDFGTARGHNRRCHTVAGVVFAKPGYVAPEVARHEVGDGRIDLYALGVMLWELIAGKRFYAGDAQQHLENAAAGKLTMPELAALGLAPAELDTVIAMLTANDPDDRYTGAAGAAADLAKVLTKAPNPTNGERGVRGRVSGLMQKLWPGEPARARSEFARLLKEARAKVSLRREGSTPPANGSMEAARQASEADPTMLPGTPYRLAAIIGEGASGTVYEAEHVELGRRAAVKVLSAGHASTDAIDRFRREARAVASLSHPNLVHLYDFGRALDGRIFFAMELLRGETLNDRIARTGRMEWREAVHVAIAVTYALEAAHEAGVVHRDLKPANLFLTEPKNRDSVRAIPLDGAPPSSRTMKLRDLQTPSTSLAVSTLSGMTASASPTLPYGVKLLDFGVAMAVADVQGEEKQQRGFAVFGTPEYMAPEQVAGESVDKRCDLYALGCVLYELVTGSRPFAGPSAVVVMGKQLREEAEPMATIVNGVPQPLETLVARAMKKSADARFTDAAEMRTALEELLVPMELSPPVIAPKRRSFARTFGTAAIASALIGTFAFLAADGGLDGVTRRAVSVATQLRERSGASTAAGASTTSIASATTPERTDETTLSAAVAPAAPAAPSARATSPAATGAAVVAPAPVAPPPATPAAPSHAADLVAVAAHEAHGAPGSHPRADDDKLEAARAFAKAHPKDPHGLRLWAIAAEHAGERAEARRAADAWSKAEPTSEPRIFLATLLDESGRHTEARAVLEDWLDDHPESTDARRLYNRMGGSVGAATVSAHSKAH
jgi:serine/threonine-protein kinase